MVGAIGFGTSIIAFRMAGRAYRQWRSQPGRIAKKFYEGGFENPMSKREAALILGCRQSAQRDKIMERYRLLMKVNHPDLGGSPFLSQKVNEAKELLLSSKIGNKPGSGSKGAR